MPSLYGNPISVSVEPELCAYRGRLVHHASPGSAVYAAAFLRKRDILFEVALLSDPETFRLILMHELFHFVWLRLGNTSRRDFSQIISDEWEAGARGELGESSGVKRTFLREAGHREDARLWRDYVCESFCDTAAWLYAGSGGAGLFTLRKRWRDRRRTWFEARALRSHWKC